MKTKKSQLRESSKRSLRDLGSVGKETLNDFKKLGVTTVDELATRDPQCLYEDLCAITKQRHDICVLDTLHCAVAQAKDPKLPKEMRNWWYWSRKRKAEG